MQAPVRWRVRRTIGCLRRAWEEIDYAQRRMFELRTGIPLTTTRSLAPRPRIEDLAALYALPARDLDDDGGGEANDDRCHS